MVIASSYNTKVRRRIYRWEQISSPPVQNCLHVIIVSTFKTGTPTHRQFKLNSIHRVPEGPGESVPPQGFDYHFLQVLELVGETPRFFMVPELGGRGVLARADHGF